MVSEHLRLRILSALGRAQAQLLASRNAEHIWRGKLSSSALSTATALIALREMDATSTASLIQRGRHWLAKVQWASGGWGDTVRSLPNLSTTLLCWAALAGAEGEFPDALERCEMWLRAETGDLEPSTIVATLRERYGKDQTFSVPILMACALSGRLGPAPECWQWVPQLPFELAALPREWFAALSLPVVSYALPALIAIGQVRHFHAPSGLGKPLRKIARARTLRLLEEIQPEGGGFLEATPLTSFVTMAIASMGLRDHPVAVAGLDFLRRSCREEGSWPIDTDLATWATTLSVKALGPTIPEAGKITSWLLNQQYRSVHPYTKSAPGGWAWTDLPGGVPDADDTSGALLALAELAPQQSEVRAAAQAGVNWLRRLQNRDGGMPTFCRGWGSLPFDRSTPEITAHAIAAWARWPHADKRLAAARLRAMSYLSRTQSKAGTWTPLWFGNQWCEGEANLVYGTASVVRDLAGVAETTMLERAVTWLLKQQLNEGGWGGGNGAPETVEETALTLTALVRYASSNARDQERLVHPLQRGFTRLLELTDDGISFPASPIGLYFARLWYFEDLYPLIWTVGALREVGNIAL
jgi:squalene-hopene/tetraprenyl-beta-curcumene cyclase